MHYSILIYDSEAIVEALSKEENDRHITKHRAMQNHMSGEGKLGPMVRLAPTTNPVSLRKQGAPARPEEIGRRVIPAA